VNQHTGLILERIRKLPAHELAIAMRSPRGTFERSFKGALLYDYAAMHGLLPSPAPPLGPGNFYFLTTAEDGFKVVLSFSEVAPRSSHKQVLLAYEQDGEPIRAGVRLVVPGDDLGGRSIGGVADIELKSAPSTPSAVRPESSFIDLQGLLHNKGRLDARALSRLTVRDVETLPTPRHGGRTEPSRRYSGVSLFALLEHAGMKLDDSINEDVLRKVIVARSTDGYATVVSTGEIEPRFMAGEVIVATSCDGEPLTEDGQFRLVVPYDKLIGRAVKCLTSIELIEG
jgi:DMSO/TMAO reductase YedYZ molybdopterin-dependent catalytic subunit